VTEPPPTLTAVEDKPPGRVSRRRARRRAAAPRQPTRAVRRRSTLLIALAILAPQLALAAALAVGLDVGPMLAGLAGGQSRAGRAPLDVGDCVRTEDGRTAFYVDVPCDDRRVSGRVIAVVTGPAAATESCAQETDFFATRPGQLVCLRRVGAEHPGDPGNGGGVYRSGDCVATNATAGVSEVPCDSPTVFETVVARVQTVADCRPPAVRFATVKHGDRRVLCLGDGPGLATTGECMGDPERTPVTFDAIACEDGAARAQILARVATPTDCRAIPKQTHYVRDPSGLPASTVVCLRKLR
jgi:hypothetical protein